MRFRLYTLVVRFHTLGYSNAFSSSIRLMRFHKTAILRRTRGLRYEIAAAIAVAIIRLSLVTATHGHLCCAAGDALAGHWQVDGQNAFSTSAVHTLWLCAHPSVTERVTNAAPIAWESSFLMSNILVTFQWVTHSPRPKDGKHTWYGNINRLTHRILKTVSMTGTKSCRIILFIVIEWQHCPSLL